MADSGVSSPELRRNLRCNLRIQLPEGGSMHHILHSAVEALAIYTASVWAIGGAMVGTVVHKIHKRRG